MKEQIDKYYEGRREYLEKKFGNMPFLNKLKLLMGSYLLFEGSQNEKSEHLAFMLVQLIDNHDDVRAFVLWLKIMEEDNDIDIKTLIQQAVQMGKSQVYFDVIKERFGEKVIAKHKNFKEMMKNEKQQA